MDVDMRLMEALGGHHGHHLQNPAPTQAESDRLSELELASAVSELINILRSNGQVPQGNENSSYPNGHLSQNHSNGPLTSQLATTLQLGLNDHALLQSLRLDEESLQAILGCSLSVAISTQEGLRNKGGTQNNSHLLGSESSGIGRNSHDEELAEMQPAIMELSQPATRANSPPPSIHGPGSFSEYSEISPAGRPGSLPREDSQSMSPGPHRSNSQVLELSPAMDVQTPQFLARNSMGRVRNSVGSSSNARQDDPYEDPAKVAERERVRGENRVRKKRWRESNQDRNKDNDLRCRVTKRGNKVWGPEDSEDKRAWMKHEFFRRRTKREAKERARAADETGLNMGAGSSSVFQAYNSSPPPMSAIDTSPIFSNFQTPFSDSQADEARVALQDLVSLLPSPNATPQNLGATKPQGPQTASRNSDEDQPDGDFHSQQLGPHQPMEIQNIASDTGSDRNNEIASGLEEVAWPAPEESSFAYYNSSQIKDMVATLRVRFSVPLDVIAGGKPPRPLESPMPRWPGPGSDENGFFETVEVKIESSEVPPEALQSIQQSQDQTQAQQTEDTAPVTLQQQGIESAIKKLSDADIDAFFSTNVDGNPDLNDAALGGFVAESGLCVDGSPPRAMEPEAPTISEPSGSRIAQSEYRGIGDLVSDDSGESMSLEQINALLGHLTESTGLDEPANTSSLHSANLFSHHQVTDPTQDTIAPLTSSWRGRQYPSIPSVDTTSRGTKRCSPEDPSPLSKRACKPPPKNPTALTQIQAIPQSPDRSQSVSSHQVNSSYVASFGNSENMNKRLMKPPPYRPASKPPSIGITTSPGSAVASHAKSNEHEKKIKSMGFPPLMAGMRPK